MCTSLAWNKGIYLRWQNQASVSEALCELIFVGPCPVFPLTSITVIYYSSAAYSSRDQCLCLPVLWRPTNTPLDQEDALQNVCGDFSPPMGACSGEDLTKHCYLDQLSCSYLEVTKPRERWVHRSWATKLDLLVQVSQVHRCSKINSECQGPFSRHDAMYDFRHSGCIWQKLALVSDFTQNRRGQNQHCEKPTKPRTLNVVKSFKSTISMYWAHD